MTDTTTQKKTEEKKTVREFSGTVVSNKMKDTAVVEVTRYVKHPKYRKFVKSAKRYFAQDTGNTKEVGDKVTIRETRPLSKRKHFEIV